MACHDAPVGQPTAASKMAAQVRAGQDRTDAKNANTVQVVVQQPLVGDVGEAQRGRAADGQENPHGRD